MFVKKFGNGIHVILNKSSFNIGDEIIVFKKSDLNKILGTDILNDIRSAVREEIDKLKG
jgi:hypothetical protein